MTGADGPDPERTAIFFRELAKGYELERAVAVALREAGITVEHAPLQVRETYERRIEYRNQQDLVLGDGDVVEVKSSSRPFTCPDDIRFDPVNVAKVAAWDRKRPEPLAVVLVSQPTGAFVVVPSRTRPSWVIAESHDHVRDIPLRTYQCPRRLIRTFAEFVDWLATRPFQKFQERRFVEPEASMTFDEWQRPR